MADKLILEFQAKTDDLGKRLKAVEGSVDKVGKTSKKVSADMTKDLEGVKDVASQISPEFGRAASAMGALTGGVGKVVTAMKTLRGAIIATGIGALVVVIGSLVSYFTSTERGAQKLRVAMAAVGAVVNTLRDAMFGLLRAGAFLLRGDLRGAIDAASEAFSGMGDRIRDNVSAMVALEKRANALKVAERELRVEMSARRAEINALRLAAEDENKSVSERIALLKQADGIEKNLMDQRIRNAEENLRIIQLQNERSENAEKDFEAQAQAEIELNNIREESSQRQRRLIMQINSLERQSASERQKRIEDERKAREMADAQRLKDAEDLAKAIEKAEADAARRREEIMRELAGIAAAIDEQMNTASEDVMRREIAATEATARARVDALKAALDENIINLYEYQDRVTEAELSRQQAVEDAEREHQERLRDIREAAEQLEVAKRQEALDKQLQAFQQYGQAVGGVINGISQIQSNATQAELFMLQDSLDQGLISREEYAEERRKIMSKQASDQKSAATFEAVINGIVAVVNAFKDGGPVLAAITAAGVAAQIAAIQSTPAPKFAEGGYVDAKGQLHGRTHRQGGVHIEAEGGEFITKASQAKKYGHIVEAVNKGTIEKLIADTYVRPAVDAAILNGWGDLQRSVEVNAAFSDHNLLRTMDRHGFAEVKELRKMNVLLAKALRPDLRKGW
jgi:hypothetical protein